MLYQTLLNAGQSLEQGNKAFEAIELEAKQTLEQAGLKPDYFAIAEKDKLKPATLETKEFVIHAAAFLGKVRLIDNLQVSA